MKHQTGLEFSKSLIYELSANRYTSVSKPCAQRDGRCIIVTCQRGHLSPNPKLFSRSYLKSVSDGEYDRGELQGLVFMGQEKAFSAFLNAGS
jgi:hypothetical protein